MLALPTLRFAPALDAENRAVRALPLLLPVAIERPLMCTIAWRSCASITWRLTAHRHKREAIENHLVWGRLWDSRRIWIG